MYVCILGGGLVSLTLAKALVNHGIYVDLFSNQKVNKINKSRTLGISKVNIDFFNKDVLDIKKLLWDIDKIEIYSENLKDEKILNFENYPKKLFSIIKNYDLYEYLISSLKKNKLFKLKKNNHTIVNKNYKLIINCDVNNFFTKKYFQKKIEKNYNSYAYTTIIDHKKLVKNNTAVQIFTKRGPLAFLPISESKTSIVYSARGLEDVDLESLIQKHNTKYSIIKINQISNFKLNSVNLRTYYYKNILAFGDLLHKLHPLAGQGFNMSIRDIKLLVDLIKFRLNHGLELDNSICQDFEKKTKHKNYLFSKGIDFVYEFFNLESRIDNSLLSKSVQFFGKNKHANKIFTKLADNGIVI
tara:strand:+ start:2359 stop:3426 length:1068 start_codon:yes stop_codon:yes gene_type:complete